MDSFLKGKNVLVTGGTGSIGSAIVKKAIKDKAKNIRVFSNDEFGQYELEKELGKNTNVSFWLGDIRDESRIEYVVKNMDYVFHAAALKHVDRCEVNPNESILTNIIGTKNLINASQKANIKKVIFISTDKAVNPVSVMGASKLLAEKLISAEAFHENSKTIFASVRFGNVLNTRGSILPFIEEQIKHGGPITLTDKKMIRFFMTKNDAVNLIISAAKIAKGGEIFVLKMPIIRLNDLFESLKKILGPKYGHHPSSIKTKIIGMKPGEKLVEELLTEIEIKRVLETKEFFIILPNLTKKIKQKYSNAKIPKEIDIHFKKIKPLNDKQILKMLKELFD
jgi:UDP-N-acetylglucosamine 4,6-dehydratase/5-epimerase